MKGWEWGHNQPSSALPPHAALPTERATTGVGCNMVGCVMSRCRTLTCRRWQMPAEQGVACLRSHGNAHHCTFRCAAVYFVQGILGLSRLATSFFFKDDLHIDPAEVRLACTQLANTAMSNVQP